MVRARERLEIPPGRTVIEHRTEITNLWTATEVDPKDPVATRSSVCVSRYPATRCECAMYDLEWCEEAPDAAADASR